MPGGKFTIPNQLTSSMFAPSVTELLGGQLPEYEPGYTGAGYTGALQEPEVSEMDVAFLLAPYLKAVGSIGAKGVAKFPSTFSNFLRDLGERGSLWRAEGKASKAGGWEGIFRRSNLELEEAPEVFEIFKKWHSMPGPSSLDLLADMKMHPGKYRFLFTDEGVKGGGWGFLPEKIQDIKSAIGKYPDKYRLLEFPDELAEVAKYKDPYQIAVDVKELSKYLQYIDLKLIDKYMKSEGKGLGTGLIDIAKAKLGEERGSIGGKLLEGHHTLPIGGQSNLDAVEWHLKNLADEGWKTVKDIPKEAHKELTKKQRVNLKGSGEKSKYIDQEEGVADPVFDRAKEKFDRTWSDFADSPLYGQEVEYGEKGKHYLTGASKEHAGMRWLQAFKPWTEEEMAKRKAYLLEARKKMSPDFKKYSGQKPEVMDPGDLGNYTYIPEDLIVSTGRRVVEPTVEKAGLIETAKKKLGEERGSLSPKKVDELIYKITGVKPTPETGLPRKIPSNKLQSWLDKGWIKGSESTTSGGTKLTTIYPPEVKPTPNYLPELGTDKGLLETAKKKLTEERGSISGKKVEKPKTKAESIFTPEYREQVIKGLANNPARKDLASEDAIKVIEDYARALASRAPGSELYLGGSYTSAKPNPSDIDVFSRLSRGWKNVFGYRPEGYYAEGAKKGPVHIIDFPPSHLGGETKRDDILMDFLDVGRERYGKDYDWIRLLSMMGLLAPLSQMIERKE